jgi:UDP-N-acetylglucosamine--N-acetylmuramyl-(pentapeptide) pyrophosphoryl-undecaprenol N-acetylglucosamine transferase
MRLPSILIPLPSATDNHQYYNARAFADASAARLLVQREATAESLAREVRSLLTDRHQRQAMRAALSRWHFADAADAVAEAILRAVRQARSARAKAGRTHRSEATVMDWRLVGAERDCQTYGG